MEESLKIFEMKVVGRRQTVERQRKNIKVGEYWSRVKAKWSVERRVKAFEME